MADVLFAYVDVGSPSAPIRAVEAGVAVQVLADSNVRVSPTYLRAGGDLTLTDAYEKAPSRLVLVYLDAFNTGATIAHVRQFRKRYADVAVCAAGLGALLNPDALTATDLFQYIVIGEPEIALYELVSCVLQGREISAIKNLWWREASGWTRNPLRAVHEHLEQLPFADRSIADSVALRRAEERGGTEPPDVYLWASRGCPHDCAFCYSPVVKKVYAGKGAYYRMRPPRVIMAEMKSVAAQRPGAVFDFVDEQFPFEPQWFREFTSLAAKEPRPFRLTACAEDLSGEAARMLAQAGAVEVRLGIESGSEPVRRRLATRNVAQDRLDHAVEQLHAAGIKATADVMLGLVGASAAENQESLSALAKSSFDDFRLYVYQPISGTALAQSAGATAHRAAGLAELDREMDFLSVSDSIHSVDAAAVTTSYQQHYFLRIGRRLQAAPQPEVGVSLIHRLPKAKLRFDSIAGIDVVLLKSNGQVEAALKLAPRSELRFPLNDVTEGMVSAVVWVGERSGGSVASTATLVFECWDANSPAVVHRERRVVVGGERMSVLVPIQLPNAGGTFVVRHEATSPQAPHVTAATDATLYVGSPTLLAGPMLSASKDTGGGADELRMSLAKATAEVAELKDQLKTKTERLAELHVELAAAQKRMDELRRGGSGGQ